MIKLIALVIVFSATALYAEEENREIAGRNDFTKDYLEKVTDERAMENLRREQARKDHEKYLRTIDRSR